MKNAVIFGFLFAVALVSRPAAATVLLTDDFNAGSFTAETFNDTLASTQGGTLATVTYNVQGQDFAAQHGNGGAMLLANSAAVFGIGNVSLNNNFAGDANAANAPLAFSFNIVNVVGYDSDPSRWVQFNVGNSQNLDVANSGVGLSLLFTKQGGIQVFTGAGSVAGGSWTAGDLVTMTFSDSAGTGSAFNGNGSKASLSVGATNIGTFTLAQQTNAYATFSAFNYANDVFGYGQFDNLAIATVAVPEPSVALLGVAAAVGLIGRRWRSRKAGHGIAA